MHTGAISAGTTICRCRMDLPDSKWRAALSTFMPPLVSN
jgi:hypothetical protein